MKRIIGNVFVLLSFFLMGNALFAQSSDKWYLGEWTNEREDFSFTLTPTSIVYSPDYSVAVKYSIDETGLVDIDYLDPEDWQGDSYYGDPKTKTIVCVQEGYEEDDYITIYHKKARQTENTPAVEPKRSISENTARISDSDNAWKAAFDGNGFLVLKSDDRFGGIGGVSNIYIILKGYGKDYKHGKFKVDKPARNYYGLFEMFDDVILFYDLRDEVELKDDRYNNFYASHSKLNEQFFTWEGSSIIKAKGIITGTNSVESFSQIKGSEAQQFAKDGIFNY